MNIKQLSQMTGLSSHTLRYYEKIKLICNIKRDSSGYRDYSQEDVDWVDFLKKLKSTGMSLADIKKFAYLRRKGDKTIPERIAFLERHKKKVEAGIAEFELSLKKIKKKLNYYKKMKKT